MPRKNEDERERQQKVRQAKEGGASPSAAGVTQGAKQQRDHEKDPSHPKQKTTHPVRD